MSTTSRARIAANKANALKSTGPRTPEGKASVANNALKHGLRSERNPLELTADSALPFEREAFEQSLAIFTDQFTPTNPYETHLVERLAQIDLRLQRAIRMETAHLDLSARRVAQSIPQPLSDEPRTHDSWLITLAFLHDPAALKLISQYESRLSRDYSRTINELRAAKKLREQARWETTQESREQTQSDTTLETLSEHTQPRSVNDDRVGRVHSSSADVMLETRKQTQPPEARPESTAPNHGTISTQSHARHGMGTATSEISAKQTQSPLDPRQSIPQNPTATAS